MIWLIPLGGVGVVAAIAYALEKVRGANGGAMYNLTETRPGKPTGKPGTPGKAGASKLTNPGNGKAPEPPFNWLKWLGIIGGAMLSLVTIWWLLRGKKQPDDVDFYAGALDIPIDEAKKMTREYLAGKYAAKKREEKYGTPDKILGLQPTSIQATYGKKNFEFGGGRSW